MRAPATVLLTLTAALLLGSCTSSHPGRPTPTRTDSVSPSPAGSPRRTDVRRTAQATPGSIRQQVTTWWYGGAEGRLGWIDTDLRTVGIDAGANPGKVGSDCTALSTDVATARSYGPVPDAQAQHHWSALLTTYQQAATDCTTGVATKNNTLITKAVTDGQGASSELNAATDRIMRIINGAA